MVTTTAPSTTPTAAQTKAPAKTAPRSQLASGAAKRTFKAPGVTVNATYSTPLPVARWTSEVPKPLNVSLSAFANSSRQQKIYLTRVRAGVSVADNSGPLTSPEALVDTANISPGYIVTSPYSYGQVFTIPSVDDGATSVTIDFTYEFLLQVTPNSKDYAKQTARDSLTIAIA